MRLAYAFLAAAAEFSKDGKLSMLGGDFDTIIAEGFPASNPAIVVVGKLVFEPGELSGPARVCWLSVGTADGERTLGSWTFPLTAESVDESPVPTDRARVGLAVNLMQLRFEAEGEYVVQLKVDDELLTSLPLHVIGPRQQGKGEA